MEYTRIALRGEKNRVALAPKKEDMMKTPEPFTYDTTTDIQLTEYPQSYWDFATPNQRILLAQIEMWKKKYVDLQKYVESLERS